VSAPLDEEPGRRSSADVHRAADSPPRPRREGVAPRGAGTVAPPQLERGPRGTPPSPARDLPPV